MTEIVLPPESVPRKGYKVFLGGAIDMGQAENWQARVTERLSRISNLILLNPRRSDFTLDKLDEQITWELEALDIADLIIMWFPETAEAPIALLETGLYMTSGKLVLGVEEGFYRKRNLELTASHFQVPLYDSLDDLLEETLRRFNSRTGNAKT